MTVSDLDPRLAAEQPGLAGAWASFRRRLGQGELGALPVIVGIAIIWVIFWIANDRFLTPGNLTNLGLQVSAVAHHQGPQGGQEEGPLRVLADEHLLQRHHALLHGGEAQAAGGVLGAQLQQLGALRTRHPLQPHGQLRGEL